MPKTPDTYEYSVLENADGATFGQLLTSRCADGWSVCPNCTISTSPRFAVILQRPRTPATPIYSEAAPHFYADPIAQPDLTPPPPDDSPIYTDVVTEPNSGLTTTDDIKTETKDTEADGNP